MRNMVETDDSLLSSQLLGDLNYTSLCDVHTSLSLSLKAELMGSVFVFYRAEGKAKELLTWLVHRELATSRSFPAVSSELLCYVCKYNSLSLALAPSPVLSSSSASATPSLSPRSTSPIGPPTPRRRISIDEGDGEASARSIVMSLLSLKGALGYIWAGDGEREREREKEEVYGAVLKILLEV